MTSTGTYLYNPAASDLVLNAYSRIGLRGGAIGTPHLNDAYNEANLLLVEWASKQPNLWKEAVQSQTISSGTATYPLNKNVVGVLICYLTIGTGSSATDRVLGPLSGQDYASLATKTITGTPSSFYFERLITPQITVWPVPDSASTYTLNWRAMVQVQDASIKGGATLDAPYRFLDAFTAGLAHRLSRMWAPQLEQQRKMDAIEAWKIAAVEDQEDVPYTFGFDFSAYGAV